MTNINDRRPVNSIKAFSFPSLVDRPDASFLKIFK
jgi:hypothetical protein